LTEQACSIKDVLFGATAALGIFFLLDAAINPYTVCRLIRLVASATEFYNIRPTEPDG